MRTDETNTTPPTALGLAEAADRILSVIPRTPRGNRRDSVAAELGILLGKLCNTQTELERLTSRLVDFTPWPPWDFAYVRTVAARLTEDTPPPAPGDAPRPPTTDREGFPDLTDAEFDALRNFAIARGDYFEVAGVRRAIYAFTCDHLEIEAGRVFAELSSEHRGALLAQMREQVNQQIAAGELEQPSRANPANWIQIVARGRAILSLYRKLISGLVDRYAIESESPPPPTKADTLAERRKQP